MKRTLDWTPEQSKLVTELLQNHLPGVKAWAYGSRARWNARPDSDLDLVVFAERSQKAQVSALREALEESSLPYKVDLFVWDEVPNNFRPQIEKEAVPVDPPVGVGHARPLRGGRNGLSGAGPRNARDWPEVTLESVADELTVGFVGSMAQEYVESGVPFLRSQNVDPLLINFKDLKFVSKEFHKKISKSRLSPGDVVVVRTGKPGACAVIPDSLADANCSDLVIIRCGLKINNHFLSYYINTVAADHVAAHLVGAVQQHFNVGSARSLRMKLPPIKEQERIAGVLRNFDDKIELNRRINQTLEEMAQALFKSWFVDFDPVRAKAAVYAAAADSPNSEPTDPAIATVSTVSTVGIGHARSLRRQNVQWQDCEQQAELAAMRVISGKTDDELDAMRESQPDSYADLARTASLFPSRLVESDLGQIPEGWETGSILQIASLLSGGTPKTSEPSYWDGDVAWASAKDVSQCSDAFLVNTERTITTVGLEKSSTKLIPALATAIVARGATTGRMTIFGREMAMNQTCYALRSKIGTPYSLYCHARQFMDEMVHAAHGAIFDTITTSTFSTTMVVLPGMDLLKAFNEAASPIFEGILTKILETELLQESRDALLPKLLSGELEIPDELLAEASA